MARRQRLRRIRDFFAEEIWRPGRDAGLSRLRALLYRLLRIVSTALREFVADQATLRASALTFYSLLSIVPLFAVLFGIAKGFGLEKTLEKRLVEQLAGQEEVLERILGFAQNLLKTPAAGSSPGWGSW